MFAMLSETAQSARLITFSIDAIMPKPRGRVVLAYALAYPKKVRIAAQLAMQPWFTALGIFIDGTRALSGARIC